jgi:hypothetical protein
MIFGDLDVIPQKPKELVAFFLGSVHDAGGVRVVDGKNSFAGFGVGHELRGDGRAVSVLKSPRAFRRSLGDRNS